MNLLSDTLPWFVAGPLIGGTLLILYYFGERFGISSSLRTICAMAGGRRSSAFFQYEWKKDIWNLVLIGGVMIGGVISYHFFGLADIRSISSATMSELSSLGLASDGQYGLVPDRLFGASSYGSFSGILLLLVGGLLVGFGARYAGGCTSGHAITGLSDFQLPSLIAVIGFFIGGLTMTHFILPFLF